MEYHIFFQRSQIPTHLESRWQIPSQIAWSIHIILDPSTVAPSCCTFRRTFGRRKLLLAEELIDCTNFLSSNTQAIQNMENVYENLRKELKPEKAKEALDLMWTRMNEPENLEKISAAKEEAGSDMFEVMKIVFPLIVDIQVETVGQFGFPRNKEGLKDYLSRVNELLVNDKEMSEMLLRIRYIYLPPSA